LGEHDKKESKEWRDNSRHVEDKKTQGRKRARQKKKPPAAAEASDPTPLEG
jgi:hypothetical protein